MTKCKACLFSLFLAGCNLAETLSTVGEPPPLSQIQDPTQVSGYQPLSMPMPTPVSYQNRTNSLWETGARAFFKDQRANKVGDVVTVIVEMDQKQMIKMTPQIQKQASSKTIVTNALGLERKAEKFFPKKQDPSGNGNPNWLNFSSNPTLNGTATYDVEDKLDVKIAATVIQILPNGNMVVKGRQELRLMNEVREVQIIGIVRKEDIAASNTIKGDKVAEMRLSYGGRGDLTDVHSFPWGHQVLNKVMPF